MSIEKTEAVILKTQPFQESSKIVRLYTKNFGKLSVIAKGARRPKSPFRAVLDTGYLVEVIFYYKEGRELQTCSQCDLIDSFDGIRENFDRAAASMAIIELVNGSAAGQETNPPLFVWICKSLKAICSADKNYLQYYWNFALHLLHNLGFQLDVLSCIKCGSQLAGGKLYFALKKGGILCASCSAVEMVDFTISAETLKLLDRYGSLPPEEISRFIPSSCARREISELLHRFMLYHLEGYRKPQSLKLLEI